MQMRAALIGLGMAVDKHARILKEVGGQIGCHREQALPRGIACPRVETYA